MLQSIEEIERFFANRENIGIKPGLERVTHMLEKVGHPERRLRAVHVAGTNGKGSTIEFLKNALSLNEYRVGLFTSPSFTGIRGHFLINDEEMTEATLIVCMNTLLPIINQLDNQYNHPTAFEIMTVIALLYFENKVDIAIIETGMGGKDDTTNCILPIVSIITNVHKDHEQFLGKTIEEITKHKAGIIKRKRPIVIGAVQPVSENIIQKQARNMNAPTYWLRKDFTYKRKDNENTFQYKNDLSISFTLQLKGRHQVENASLALMALHILHEKSLTIDWKQVTKSFQTTTLPGRFEIVHNRPTIVLDSAHNVAGIKAFVQTVDETYSNRTKHILFGAFKDKQLTAMVRSLQKKFPVITLTTFNHARAANGKDFLAFTTEKSIQFTSDWKQVLQDIIQNEHQNEKDVYFVTGSLHFITLVRTFLR